MLTPRPSAAGITANARARAEGTAQARTLQSPMLKRSEMLSQLLAEGQKAPARLAGYGDVAGRLLGQYLLQRASDKTDNAIAGQASNADLARRQRIAAGIGGTVEGSPVEVGNGRLDNPLSGLARMLHLGGQEASPEAAPVPQAAPPVPAPMPTVTNTQTPVESPTAPVAPVQGQPLPPAGQMPAPAQPPAQAAPVNPLGPAPGEIALIQQWLNSGDPGLIAQAEQKVMEIQARAAAPASTRQEFQAVNGVPGVSDAALNQWTPTPGGVPDIARNTNATVGANNPYGVPSGSGVSLDPFNRPQIIGQPQPGYERVGGRLQAESGGSADLAAPAQAFRALSDVRGEVRPILDQATQAQRNIRAVRVGAQQGNGPGDIAMFNGFQRLVDEGVVREGDVNLQLRSNGIEGGLAGLKAYITSTGRIDDRIRGQLLAAAENLYSEMNNVYRDRALGYAPMVNRTFGDGAFDDVLPASTREAFGWAGVAPPSSGGDARPQSRPASSRRAPARAAAPSAANDDPLGIR